MAGSKRPFRRRIYHGLRDLLSDLQAMMAQRHNIKRAMRGDTLDHAFRERLMLTVTEVNGCRYCSYAHARMALAAGVTPEQIKALSAGLLDDCPPEEATALSYAQHWAESDGKPAPEARERLRQTYGEEQSDAIELVLRMIRMGNLLGNTSDYWLWRLSFGCWDVDRPPRTGRASPRQSAAGGEM